MIISYDNHKEYAFLWIDESVGTHICFVTLVIWFKALFEVCLRLFWSWIKPYVTFV